MRKMVLSLLICAGAAAHAQSPLTRSEQAFVDFGFATQLGSGVYTMSGRTLQVYRLPFNYAFDHADDARARLRLNLPVTFGFLDFEPIDVLATGLPESLDSLGFVPGFELTVMLSPAWTLAPFVEAGIARDRSSELDERIYAAGVRSRYDRALGVTDGQFHGELLSVRVEQRSLDSSDDFTRLQLGVTARRAFDPAGEGRRADYLLYGFTDLFLDSAESVLNGEPGAGDDPQFEVGVTFGTTETIRIWQIPLPRVGFGYRFGDGLSVYRLVLGGPF